MNVLEQITNVGYQLTSLLVFVDHGLHKLYISTLLFSFIKNKFWKTSKSSKKRRKNKSIL